MTLLNPTDALARAVAGVASHGFLIVARNTRGDSVYLKPEGSVFALRVSNHARTPKQRANHPDSGDEPRHPPAEDRKSDRRPGGGGPAELRGRMPEAGGLRPAGSR